jgi:hypothetical protein
MAVFLSLCCGCSPTATTAPSLRSARPKQFPYKVPVSPASHHHPKFSSFSFCPRWAITPGVDGAPTSPPLLTRTLLVGYPSVLEGVDPSTMLSPWFSTPVEVDPFIRSSSSFSATRWTSRLLASRISVRKPSCRTPLISSQSWDAAAVLCLGCLFVCCLVAAVSGLGPLCHCCIPGHSNVSSRTSVLSGFLVPHCPGCISCDRVPCAVPLLYSGSSYLILKIMKVG